MLGNFQSAEVNMKNGMIGAMGGIAAGMGGVNLPGAANSDANDALATIEKTSRSYRVIVYLQSYAYYDSNTLIIFPGFWQNSPDFDKNDLLQECLLCFTILRIIGSTAGNIRCT